jgi:hypothetical protein
MGCVARAFPSHSTPPCDRGDEHPGGPRCRGRGLNAKHAFRGSQRPFGGRSWVMSCRQNCARRARQHGIKLIPPSSLTRRAPDRSIGLGVDGTWAVACLSRSLSFYRSAAVRMGAAWRGSGRLSRAVDAGHASLSPTKSSLPALLRSLRAERKDPATLETVRQPHRGGGGGGCTERPLHSCAREARSAAPFRSLCCDGGLRSGGRATPALPVRSFKELSPPEVMGCADCRVWTFSAHLQARAAIAAAQPESDRRQRPATAARTLGCWPGGRAPRGWVCRWRF